MKVKKGHAREFIHQWKELTKGIAEHQGGWGSRLHLTEEGVYLAYAQWPDRKTWSKARKNADDSLDALSREMRKHLDGVTVLHQMEMVEDLLIRQPRFPG